MSGLEIILKNPRPRRHRLENRDNQRSVGTRLRPQKIGSMVEWFKRRNCDQHGLSPKPIRATLLCTALSPTWWSWQAVLNFSYTFIRI